MTEEQAKKMIELLQEIIKRLEQNKQEIVKLQGIMSR